jgi:hypothetical protein
LRRLDNAAIANRLVRLDKRLKRDEAAGERHTAGAARRRRRRRR